MKSVLSAMSSYFLDVLRNNPCQHPVIIMPHDVLFEDVVSIISYIYKGEVTVAADKMMSVLKVAKSLHISGMTSSNFVPADSVHTGSCVARTSDISASGSFAGASAKNNIHNTVMPNSKPLKNLESYKHNTSLVLRQKNCLAEVKCENSSVATSAKQQYASVMVIPQKFPAVVNHENSSVVACPSDNSLRLNSHTCDTSLTDTSTHMKVSDRLLFSSSLSLDLFFSSISNADLAVQEASISQANSELSDRMNMEVNCTDDGVVKEVVMKVDEEEF